MKHNVCHELNYWPGIRAPSTHNHHHPAQHWDEIIRLVASVKAATVAPSIILKKLAAFPRQKRLHFALSELGHLERTSCMLDWLESPALRRRYHAGLNKGESRHALAPAVFLSIGAGKRGPRLRVIFVETDSVIIDTLGGPNPMKCGTPTDKYGS